MLKVVEYYHTVSWISETYLTLKVVKYYHIWPLLAYIKVGDGWNWPLLGSNWLLLTTFKAENSYVLWYCMVIFDYF